MIVKKINYLSNKELLLEIHRSKLSYCSLIHQDYQDKIYGYYDIIINDLAEIDQDCIAEARSYRANRLYKYRREELLKLGFKPHEIRLRQGLETVPVEDIVFRQMTFDHIPPDPERAAKGRKTADNHQKVNFPPFRHYVIRNSRYAADGAWIGGDFVEVLRSHWIGSAETGRFSAEHGQMTARLAMMLMRLVEKYAQRGNWRGYTYVDEMRGQALMQLSQIGLQFNEGRSNTPNPFSYYTAAITNSFRRILNIEKKNQAIRDDILLMHGVNPSFTRQLEHEQASRAEEGSESLAVAAPVPAKPGRPAKKVLAVQG